MVYFDPNIIVWFLGENLIRLYHPFKRRNIIISMEFCEAINKMKTNGMEIETFLQNKNLFQFLDATKFNLWNCMYNNPNQFDENIILKNIPKSTAQEVLDYLFKIKFISRNKNFPKDLVKSHAFDRYKGNINEQIATESLFRKEKISNWWVKQKFDTDSEYSTKNLYKFVQDNFLENYFKSNLKGKTVLEIGCGTGYYTKKMSNNCLNVVGIDYEKEYIDSAKKNLNSSSNIEFYVRDITNSNIVDSLSGQKFDLIFMIDIFLFLFDKKFQPQLFNNKNLILSNIAKLLDNNGSVIIMDPHLFWLSAREGTVESPISILTEYKNKKFSTIPTLGEYSSLFLESGFLIKNILEPDCIDEYNSINSFDFAFSNEFPQWVVWELVKNV